MTKPKRKKTLSTREQEVADLLVEGLSNSEIAEKLFIAHGTVKTHVSNILHKVDVNTRQQAVVQLLKEKYEKLLKEARREKISDSTGNTPDRDGDTPDRVLIAGIEA
jgi:DNA-binding CsgD family transcriptional regulator